MKQLRSFWIVLTAISAVGCAGHKPVVGAKVEQAERAVDEAKQAGAALSAPQEFKTAQDKLKAAQTAKEKGDRERAIRSAEQATIDADYARARAANQRVNTRAEEMAQYINALREDLGRLPQ
jgi:hypothetical protein